MYDEKINMDKEGLQLAARFAWSAGACSSDREGKQKLINCVAEGKFDGIVTVLSRYKGMMLYLGILAREMQRGMLSEDVVRTYWLGGEALKNFSPDFLPFHLFKVLREPVNPDDCMIRWGPVTEIKEEKLIAVLNSVDGKREEMPAYLPGFLPDLKNGDTVAVHWGKAVKILTPKEEKELDYWTKEVLKSRR